MNKNAIAALERIYSAIENPHNLEPDFALLRAHIEEDMDADGLTIAYMMGHDNGKKLTDILEKLLEKLKARTHAVVPIDPSRNQKSRAIAFGIEETVAIELYKSMVAARPLDCGGSYES